MIGSRRSNDPLWMDHKGKDVARERLRALQPSHASTAVDLMTIDLAGSERVRRLPRRHPRSAPHDGVSDGPGAFGSRSPERTSSRGCGGLVERYGRHNAAQAFQHVLMTGREELFDGRPR